MQRTKSKILSILLSLVMLLSLLPTTALAAGNYPAANAVSVDGSKDFSSGSYYKNGDNAGSFSGAAGNYNAHYDSATGTLTLSGYDGGRITLGGASYRDLTIKLIGNNTVTVGSGAGIVANSTGCNITITADNGSSGKLTITATSGNGDAYGIGTSLASGAVSGNVTIKGYADVTINATTNGLNDYSFGIYAGEVVIEDHAKVAIYAKAPSNTVDDQVYGIYAKTNVTIDTAGEITVDASDAGTGYSTGVNSMGNLTLTKAGRMTVKWNGNSGAPFYPTNKSFSDTDHAINVDKANRYASYRFGTPHTVEVVNGTLTGPGVLNAKSSGKFLENDTVSITPYERKGKSGEDIPFKGWTSSDVTLSSPTTAANSFTVPNKDVTVTAKHDPFDGAPTFTPTGDLNDRGVLTFKTMVKPHDGNEYFALVEVGNEGNESNYITTINPSTTSTGSPYVYSCEASSRHGNSYVAPGEYYIAEKLNGWWYLGEKFTVNYVKPHPEISVSNWPDPTVLPSEDEGYAFAQARILTIDNKGTADTGPLTITVEGANPTAFTVYPSNIKNIAASGKVESTVRPAKDLPAGIYTATLKISGDNVNTLRRNVKFIVKDPNASAAVSGTITSYGDTGENVTVTLTKQDETTTAFTDTLTGVPGTAPYSQNYSFATVPAGTYTLKVEKKGHAPWTEEITVATDNIGKDVTVYLWGDVNRDGDVDLYDLLTLQQYLAKNITLTETQLLISDVTKDDKVDLYDLLTLQQYLARNITSFD